MLDPASGTKTTRVMSGLIVIMMITATSARMADPNTMFPYLMVSVIVAVSVSKRLRSSPGEEGSACAPSFVINCSKTLRRIKVFPYSIQVASVASLQSFTVTRATAAPTNRAPNVQRSQPTGLLAVSTLKRANTISPGKSRNTLRNNCKSTLSVYNQGVKVINCQNALRVFML